MTTKCNEVNKNFMPVQECVLFLEYLFKKTISMIMDSTAQFSSYFNMCLKTMNIIDVRKLYYSFTNSELFMDPFVFVSNYTI